MCKNLYCIKCDIFKPVRTRHCNTCNKCVLRFDHHCPWTGNCIGKKNLKVFIQFLFYLSFSFIFFSITQMISYLIVLKNNVQIQKHSEPFIVVDSSILYISYQEDLLFKVTIFFSFVIGMSVVYLFAYQVKNMEKNLTTVEHCIIKDRDYSPFDTGCIK